MEKLEEELKNIILERYGTLNDFSREIGIGNTTLHAILNRGVNKSGMSNIITICHALHISVDSIADGKIVFQKREEVRRDLYELFTSWRNDLYSYDNLRLKGKVMTEDEKRDLIDSIDLGIERIIRKRKRG